MDYPASRTTYPFKALYFLQTFFALSIDCDYVLVLSENFRGAAVFAPTATI